MDYLEYSLWRSWLVCGVAGQQVLMTGCKTEEAAAALLRPADGIQGIANNGCDHIAHLCAARFLQGDEMGVALLVERWRLSCEAANQAEWRDDDAIAHEPPVH